VRIEAPITRTEREVVLLGENRARLTANMVLGRLDVCLAAAHVLAGASDALLEAGYAAEPELEETNGNA
jgi:hypothetical protein